MFKFVMTLIGLGLFAGQGHAALNTFVGEDLQPTANPTIRTNSDAAAASFISAASPLGPLATITFESAPLGSFSNLVVAPGVSINGSDYLNNPQTIRNTTNFPSYPSVDGSNTTAAGANFVEQQGGSLTFTFSQPTQFFGAYLTGVQTNFFADTVTFSDGATQSITLAGTGTSNGVGEIAFIGFTDAGKAITSITINAGLAGGSNDFIGVDDVTYQFVPEPSAVVLFGLGAVGLLAVARRRRTA